MRRTSQRALVMGMVGLLAFTATALALPVRVKPSAPPLYGWHPGGPGVWNCPPAAAPCPLIPGTGEETGPTLPVPRMLGQATSTSAQGPGGSEPQAPPLRAGAASPAAGALATKALLERLDRLEQLLIRHEEYLRQQRDGH